jgi:hypothetical protein
MGRFVFVCATSAVMGVLVGGTATADPSTYLMCLGRCDAVKTQCQSSGKSDQQCFSENNECHNACLQDHDHQP